MKEPIPTVWRIDVEPNEFQPGGKSEAWSGFVAMTDVVARLRPRLEDRSGAPLHPTWLLRLDPDIQRCFGRADFVTEHHGPLVDGLRRDGDPLGIHVHPYRWDAERQVTYSDHTDGAWAAHCLAAAADTFERRFGEPTRRSSQGGYYLGEAVVDAAVELGIEVDVTAEPGLPPLTADPSFGAYATGPSTDYRQYPRRPYYPSRRDAGVAAASAEEARPILIVPLAAYDFQTALAPLRRRILNRLRRRPRRHLPLNPWRSWPSPRAYWDLVTRAVEAQAAMYLAFAIRTDAPESATGLRARAVVEALADHPIGKRLRFVDPLGPEIRRLATASGGWSGSPPLPRRRAT